MISQFYSGGLSAQHLGDLTEALHQYNQENVVHSMGETVLTLEEVVSTLPHITEMIPMIPVSEAALVTPISSSPAYIETTLEPVYVQVSLEGMNIDNPTQPH